MPSLRPAGSSPVSQPPSAASIAALGTHNGHGCGEHTVRQQPVGHGLRQWLMLLAPFGHVARWASPFRVPGPSWLTRLDTRRVPAVIDRGMAPFSAITHRDAHGADWAQAVDFTVVVTLRCDVQPLQLVAATRTRRRPWPVMIGILNDIGTRYPGPVAHDATGGGTVVAE